MIITADPGRSTGVSVFSGGPIPAVTTMRDPTPAEVLRLLRWARVTARERGEPVVVQVEDQYAAIRWVPGKGGKRPTIDLPALLAVVRSAEIWVVCARLLGLEVVRTLPNTWQADMLPKDKGKTTKQRARTACAEVWTKVAKFDGVPEELTWVTPARMNEHTRDAALMGRWLVVYGGRE